MKLNRYTSAMALLAVMAVPLGCASLDGSELVKLVQPVQAPRAHAIEIPRQVIPEDLSRVEEDSKCAALENEQARILCLLNEIGMSVPDSERVLSASLPEDDREARPVVIEQIIMPPEVAASRPASVGGLVLKDPLKLDPKGLSSVGDRSYLEYVNGLLEHSPFWFWGQKKRVEMTERVQMFRYECHDLIPGTQHRPIIEVMAAVKPSRLWEVEYHRAVAIYGGLGTGEDLSQKDVVNQNDIQQGAATYLGQHQEALCALVRSMSLTDMLERPSLGAAGVLNEWVKKDAIALFDITVQTTKVVVPDALTQSLALKATAQPVESRCVPPKKKGVQKRARSGK